MRILVLGGTTEASALARLLAERPAIEPILSLAGRTQNPVPLPIPMRVGGFGGVEGLVEYLHTRNVAVVVDATHPFAERMSAHAALACGQTKIPLAVLSRPPWARHDDDHWIGAADMEEAAQKLGAIPKRVFLTVGRLRMAAFEAAPWHFYLIRGIEPFEPPNLPNHAIILGRPPFSIEDEKNLMQAQAIDCLVTKNSGGAATYAKVAAARHLNIPVVMVDRPPRPAAKTFFTPEAILAYLEGFRT